METIITAESVLDLLDKQRDVRINTFNSLVQDEIKRCDDNANDFQLRLSFDTFGVSRRDVQFIRDAGYIVVNTEKEWLVTLP